MKICENFLFKLSNSQLALFFRDSETNHLREVKYLKFDFDLELLKKIT